MRANDNRVEFNPLSWSILFFSLWYTLRSLNQSQLFSWFLFAMSVILLASIYFNKLREILSSSRIMQLILPTIFILTIAGFIFGVVLVLKDLNSTDQIIAAFLSFILLGTYLMVEISRLRRLSFRIMACLVLIALFLCRQITLGFDFSWPLLIIIVQAVWATILPNKFNKIPLI